MYKTHPCGTQQEARGSQPTFFIGHFPNCCPCAILILFPLERLKLDLFVAHSGCISCAECLCVARRGRRCDAAAAAAAAATRCQENIIKTKVCFPIGKLLWKKTKKNQKLLNIVAMRSNALNSLYFISFYLIIFLFFLFFYFSSRF